MIASQQMLDGVPFDQEEHRRQMDHWRTELEPLQQELCRLLGGINPDFWPATGGMVTAESGTIPFDPMAHHKAGTIENRPGSVPACA